MSPDVSQHTSGPSRLRYVRSIEHALCNACISMLAYRYIRFLRLDKEREHSHLLQIDIMDGIVPVHLAATSGGYITR